MNDSYRATLIIVGLLLAMSLASWRLLQLESAPALAHAMPTPVMGTNNGQKPELSEFKPAVQVSPPRDRVADLIAAAQRGDISTVLKLAGKGVNINATGQDGLTPLLSAIAHGNITPAQIEKLIRAGADVTARDSKGRDALTLAAEQDDLNSIVALLRGSSKLAGRASDALNNAAAQNHVEALKAMLDNGVDINTAGKEGRTALDAAIGKGDADTVRFLLGRGADPGHKDAKGETALMHAVARGDLDVAQAVLEKASGSINEKNGKGETALLQAVHAKNFDLVRTLSDAGSDVNAADSEGSTPLMAAAAAGQNDVVQLLLDKGADWRLKDAQGETALSRARKSAGMETVDLLIKAGAVDDTPQ